MQTRVSLMAIVSSCFLALASSAHAQDAEVEPNGDQAQCPQQGMECKTPPNEWVWNRFEHKSGLYSVELPCVEVDYGDGLFSSGTTLSDTGMCWTDSSAFIVELGGVPETHDLEEMSDADRERLNSFLNGAPDLFTAVVNRVSGDETVKQVTIQGRRVIVKPLELTEGYGQVANIEISRFGQLILSANIQNELNVSREQGEALIDRFFNSVEFPE